MSTHLAVAIAGPDQRTALAQAHAAAAYATLAEYRLDLITDFDLPRLVADSPLPAIMTCRSVQEGGRFAGPALERRQILADAVRLGAPFVDAEGDVLPDVAALHRPYTRIIGSYHNWQTMPDDWAELGRRLRADGADIVKLVGVATQPDDVVTPLQWLHDLDYPGIALAMGDAGIATRLLAPRFAHAFLTFAASADATAPGQLPARDVAELYQFHRLATADPCFVLLTPPSPPWPLVQAFRQAVARTAETDAAVVLPLPVTCFGPGLLQALRLARIAGIACTPDVQRHPALAQHGLDPTANAWRLDATLYPALSHPPDPDAVARFWLRSRM